MSAPPVLISGGAGVVGRRAKALARAGYQLVVYDNLTNDIREALKRSPLEVGDLEDEARLAEVVVRHKPVGVLHFAAFMEAGEWVRQPEGFYQNNVTGSWCSYG